MRNHFRVGVLDEKNYLLVHQVSFAYFQANAILKSRDLGSIICDITFSELTYLDAFWRDYINGSLLEALKGVFITGWFGDAPTLEGWYWFVWRGGCNCVRM